LGLRSAGHGDRVDVNDRTWSPPRGFNHLGFTFWNWAQTLSPLAEAEVARRLGHRTGHPYGKL
jgi:hypothetical protein